MPAKSGDPRKDLFSMAGQYAGMLLQLLSLAVIVVLFLPFIAAGYYYNLALLEARRWIPQPLHEQGCAIYTINSLIWSDVIPDAARRNYLRSHVFACVGFAIVTLFGVSYSGGETTSLAHGPLVGGVLSGGMTIFYIVFTARLWLRYRRRRQANVSPPATAP